MAKINKSYVSAVNKNNVTTGAMKKQKVKSFFGNPLIQFVILGVIFALVQILASAGIVPSKYATVCVSIMTYTIICEGFCLLLGYAGLASLGSAGFVGTGAYCIFYVMQIWGLPYIVAILMALVISMLLGLAIGFISLRIQGLFLGIVTLGLSEIIRNILMEIYSQGVLLKTKRLKLFGTVVGTKGMYFVIAIMVVLVLIILYNLMHSPTGRNMLAMKNSTSAAQAFGVNLLKYRVLAFVIACMLASLTGVCYLQAGFSITPANSSDPVLSMALSLNVLAAVIIGGYKSLWGTFAGVVFVFGLTSAFSAFFPTLANAVAAYTTLAIGVIMIIIVMFYPGGFYQLYYQAKFGIKKLKAKWRLRTYGNE